MSRHSPVPNSSLRRCRSINPASPQLVFPRWALTFSAAVPNLCGSCYRLQAQASCCSLALSHPLSTPSASSPSLLRTWRLIFSRSLMRCRGRQLDWLDPLECTGLDYNCTQVPTHRLSLSHTHAHTPVHTLDFTRPPFSWCFFLPLQRKREDERRIRRSGVTNRDLLGSPPLVPESGAGRWWRRPVKGRCKMYLRSRFDARELDQYVKKVRAGITPGYFTKTSHGLLFDQSVMKKRSCV